MSDELGVVTAGVPEQDDCPILTRINAFLVDQGMPATLQHVMRDRNGNPIDLSSLFGAGGESISNPDDWTGQVIVRVREEAGVGTNAPDSPLWEGRGEPYQPSLGILRFDLTDEMVRYSGIYRVGWAIKDTTKNKIVAVNNTLMSVERSLFSDDTQHVGRGLGSLTIQEVRTYMRDNSGIENLRIQDVEYSDSEIVSAITRPIAYWNEVPPPIGLATTRTFQWREHWLKGTMAQLFAIAANWYLRNKQNITAGGISDDDLNRNQEYQRQADTLWEEYKNWVYNKKLEINYQMAAGIVRSPYGRGY